MVPLPLNSHVNSKNSPKFSVVVLALRAAQTHLARPALIHAGHEKESCLGYRYELRQIAQLNCKPAGTISRAAVSAPRRIKVPICLCSLLPVNSA